MHSQRQRFLLHTTALTGLGEFRLPGRHRDDLPASTRSQTGEDLHEQPRRSPLDTPAIPALPRPVGDLLKEERAPLPHDLMGEAPMQTLAMGGEFLLSIRQASLGVLLSS
jgi:hypothetical protein